jgi:2,4-dienoyl-CoA reductase-like NADH-dependent reductase (Old Yellow Enzyme family)
VTYRRIASLRTASDFRAYLEESGIPLEFDDEMIAGAGAPLAHVYRMANGFVVGNRFCVLPMEGWDGTADGCPSEFTIRRWRRFGASGAKLVWGGEAVAVRHDGRANPNQLMISEPNIAALAKLRQELVASHAEGFGKTDDLFVGLQLTHSGRFCRPNDKKRIEPKILYHHPVLDRKFGVPANYPVMTDDEIKHLIDDFICAAQRAARAGFQFVDIKHCHGYLGHEFLSAVKRPGPFGGSLENRTRFLSEIVQGIRANAPGLEIGVRFSAFDLIPFSQSPNGVGEPEPYSGTTYPYAFGGDGTGLGIDLSEPKKFLDILAALGIRMVCITAGSPYYNPHLMRPATFPPSDGYQPPEDPLFGVARLVHAAAELKRSHPDLLVVGSGYSYLQEWLPHTVQHTVRTGGADFVGMGRTMLTYPQIVADSLAGRTLQRKRICRSFSDCTTAPRNGLVSGCYPLDEYYKHLPEARALDKIKHSKPT